MEESFLQLGIILIVLVIISGIFSASETAMLSVNRYKLRHNASRGNKSAILILKLLDKPDRLLGIILLGNNFVNILASSLATVIVIKFFGSAAIAISSIVMTFIILIFAEVAPKTLAALYPMALARPMSYVLNFLLKVFYPIVFVVNLLANGFLLCFGVRVHKQMQKDNLNKDELKTLIQDPQLSLPKTYRKRLEAILELERLTVEDVMVPKQDIHAIDLSLGIEFVRKVVNESKYTRLPVHRGNLDEIVGVLDLHLNRYSLSKDLTIENINEMLDEVLFVPETTNLETQIQNFNTNKKKFAIVVDEYGHVQGLLSMKDVLEEIVGTMTTDMHQQTNPVEFKRNEDGSLIFLANEFIRDLNKEFDLDLPEDASKTLNGLIQEHLQHVPQPGDSIELEKYQIVALTTDEQNVEKVLIRELEVLK